MIRLHGGLAYVTVELSFKGQSCILSNVILDTGSVSTVFSIDAVSRLGLEPLPQDELRRVQGIGGSEYVYSKRLDVLRLDELYLNNFMVQIGVMDYGIDLDGILGLDFLLGINATINLATLSIDSHK